MNTDIKSGQSRGLWPRILAAGLKLTLLSALSLSLTAAALPKPAQAEVTCKAYHPVRAGYDQAGLRFHRLAGELIQQAGFILPCPAWPHPDVH